MSFKLWFNTGTYFNCIMFMVASSVVSTILILNYHHRSADTHEMSNWVRSIINNIINQSFFPCRLLDCFLSVGQWAEN